MRRGLVMVVIVMSMLVGLVVAPSAPGRTQPCKGSTVRASVGGHPTCIAKRLVRPAPTKAAPGLVQLQGALTLTQAGFTTRSGKRAAPLSRRSWTTARARLLKATSATFARIAKPLRRPARAMVAASDACQVIDIVSQGGTFGTDGRPATSGGSYTSNGVSVSLDVTRSGGMQLGMQTTVNGDTYTMKYESGESDCTKHALPPCPTADGGLDASGTKGKVGFSMTVARGGQVLTRRSYAKTINVETKGQVADDAKLDYVDVRYSETTVVEHDGLRYTSYATRSTRIDMRAGRYAPGDSVSFGSASLGGQLANTTGIEVDAHDFAAFVGKTIDEYRGRERAWQRPGTCAKLTFDPASGAITVHRGDTGTFSAKVVAVKGGGTAAKARWTLSSQQNGTFSPTSTKEREPSFTYTVTSQPRGQTLSVAVRATSTAGVAQETWSQKIEDELNAITGTFTGHATDLGVVYDWTGTATFRRVDVDTGGPGGVFQLASGQATVTVSGSLIGGGCSQTGTSSIGLFGQSPWTVTGAEAPFSYQIVAPFLPDTPQATNVNCSDRSQNGTPAGLGSMPVPALQSGDIAAGAAPTGLVKTTNDLYAYTGSASASSPGSDQTVSWTWSFTGAP
jgi:hypothetical protein